MLAAVRSATLIGVDGQPVTVEVHVSSGLPAYQVVGLPDAAVRESRERVRAAVLSSGLEWPQRRITVNLAPGGVRKSGSGLELAVALGALGANDALPGRRARRRRGAGRARARRRGATRCPAPSRWSTRWRASGVECVVVPLANAAEAALVGGVRVRAARTLGELRACLKGEEPWPDWDPPAVDPGRRRPARRCSDDELVDLADVRGLPFAREALEVAAAGGPPPAVLRSAGHRQDHARPAARHHPPAAVARRGARGHPHPLGGRRAGGGTARARAGRSALRTTPRRPPRSSAAGAGAPAPARSRSRTAVCSSSTSSASSRRARSTRCGNRSRSARCGSRASRCRSRSPPPSSWSRAPTRARAARARRGAGAARRNASATGDG